MQHIFTSRLGCRVLIVLLIMSGRSAVAQAQQAGSSAAGNARIESATGSMAQRAAPLGE